MDIDGIITDDSFQQEFYELFKYGIFHHIFAVFMGNRFHVFISFWLFYRSYYKTVSC